MLKETTHTTLETKIKGGFELQPHKEDPGPVLEDLSTEKDGIGHDDENKNSSTEQTAQTFLYEYISFVDKNINYKKEDKLLTTEATYHSDSDSTLILDDALETPTKNITSKSDVDIVTVTLDNRASTSTEYVTLEKDDTVKENAGSLTIEQTKLKHKPKKVQLKI